MKIDFSKHALEQIQLRQINLLDAVIILENLDEIIIENAKRIYLSIAADDNKNYSIRIFVNTEKNPNLIITVYKTSKIYNLRWWICGGNLGVEMG